MRESWGRTLRLGVAGTGVALLQTSWARRQPPKLLGRRLLPRDEAGAAAVAPAALAGAAATLLAETHSHGLPATLVLGDDCVRQWMVTPPANSGRLADLQAVAAARFEQLYGESADGYRLSAAWQARRPFLAAAVAAPLYEALCEVMQACGLRLQSMQPHYVTCWNRWQRGLAADAWLGVVQGGQLSLGLRQGGRLMELRSLGVSAALRADAKGLRGLVQREALRALGAEPSALALCGDVPPAWLAAGGGGWDCRVLQSQAELGLGDAGEALARLAMAGLA